MKPLCFVLMPFGRKPEGGGRIVDFDAVYHQIIAPAVLAAGMEAIRADQEQVGGTIHKPMFERLMLCDYAVADMTGANPNVYYELGIRHALRPRSTVIIFAQGTTLPFDLAMQRGTPYRLDASGSLTEPAADAALIADRLRSAHEAGHDDSPLFQLVDGMPRLEIDHAKTDIFRDRVAIAAEYKAALAEARKAGIEAVRAVAADPRLADLRNVEAGIIVDMMLSFRAVGTQEGCEEMIALHARMPRELQPARMVREQLGFALNRVGRRAEAEKVLGRGDPRIRAEQRGQRPARPRLQGHVGGCQAAGRGLEAKGHLKRAVASYRAGFEADWRDAYPGVNAVTLMALSTPPDPALGDLLPVVRYAASQRVRADERGTGDYWDQATLLELAVIGGDPDGADGRGGGGAVAGQRAVAAGDDGAQPPPHPRGAGGARRGCGMDRRDRGGAGRRRGAAQGAGGVTRLLHVLLLPLLALVALAVPAAAHPHVFVDVNAELIFDDAGRIKAVGNVWQFDDAFSAFAIEGLDADGDGKLSDEELQPLAKINVESLADFEYFTWLTIDGVKQKFMPPTEYWLQFDGTLLTLFYTLPLDIPVVVGKETTLEIFDPEYFVAFTFPGEQPLTLVGAPDGCTATYHPPQGLDDQTMAELNALPYDQRQLPPDLQAAADNLADAFSIDCPVSRGRRHPRPRRSRRGRPAGARSASPRPTAAAALPSAGRSARSSPGSRRGSRSSTAASPARCRRSRRTARRSGCCSWCPSSTASSTPPGRATARR